MNPQLSQAPQAAQTAMPSQPEAFPDMPADPTLQVAESAPRFGQSVVPPPAPHVSAPLVAQLITGATSSSVPHLSHLGLESLQTLRCYPDPLPAIQPKAQELSFPNPPCPALGGVHLQTQMFLDPGPYRSQRSFRRRWTAYVDVAVIRIAAEAVPSSLQFLIERIQIDVGQQRRQRSALRRPLHAGFHHPVHHRAPPQVLPNQMQHPFVTNHYRNPSHQNVVIDLVEELRDVYIHHPVLPSLRILLCGAYGVLCAAPRPKPITVLAEGRIE